jgi:glycosyltransferase involved in cell wall biosynthesis
MRISVITVCYNSERTIERTIQSVLAQILCDIEYIVIDGSSKDTTISIINKYKKNIDVFVSEKDCGIYDAFNKGLLYATGDIITFLNSDDYYADINILNNVSKEFLIEPSLDMIYGDVVYTKNKKVVRYYSSKKFKMKCLAYGFMPAHPSTFINKDIYKKYGLFDKSFIIAGDFEFITRILQNNLKIKYINKVLTIMSLGGKSSFTLSNFFLVNREILRACNMNRISTNIFKIYLRYLFKIMEYLKK